MPELGWWIAVGQVVLTAGILLVAMLTRFSPGAGSVGLRLVLFASIAAGLALTFSTLRRADAVGGLQLWAGTVLNGLSHLLFWGAVAAHGASRPSGAFASAPPEVLTLTGSYRLMRHPFYVSYVLAFGAAAVFCAGPGLWLLTLWMAGLYALAAAQEERLILHSPLSARYEQYCRSVGMFLPRRSRARRTGPCQPRASAFQGFQNVRPTSGDPRHHFAKAHLPLMTAAEYRRALRPLLPPGALQPSFRAVYTLVLAVACTYASYVPLAYMPSRAWALVFGPVAGVCLASALFAAHDVSHGSSVRHRLLRYSAEVLAFSPFLLSATAWQRFHNGIHHRHTSTLNDSDRLPSPHEQSPALDRLLKWMVPQEGGSVWTPLMGAHSLLYSALIAFWTLFPGSSPNGPNKATPVTRTTRARVLVELGLMLVAQSVIYRLCGSDLGTFMIAAGLSLFTASSIANAYIYTNHFLNPISPSVDPVIGSTSVVVPRWLDWLHSHFSHHTEHHLYPGMASRHYPLVRQLLLEHYPERFNCLPIADVYRLLMRSGPYASVRGTALVVDS